MKIAIIAMLALVCAVSNAEARQHHRLAHQIYSPECNVSMPCEGAGNPIVSQREQKRLARGQELYNAMPFGTVAPRAGAASAFIRGRMICARNVNAELAARGIRGTGTAWAKDFLTWGHRGSGQVGDVAVFNRGRRGGHVAIVVGFGRNGERLYLNPSSRRQAWKIGPYHRQPIAFRSPS